jgi:hypothetical protein
MAINTVSASGDTASAGIKIFSGRGHGGSSSIKTVAVTGTFSSGTAALQMSVDGGLTWFAVTNSAGAVTFAANGAQNIVLIGDPSGDVQVRISVSGSSSNAALVLSVVQER